MSGLPAGWSTVALAKVTTAPKKVDPVMTGRQSVRYLEISGIDGDRHVVTTATPVESATAPSRCRQPIRSGDTVFSTVRPNLERIAYIDDSLDDEFASTGFCVLRPTADLDPRYLFHYASSPLLLDQVVPLQKGMSYPAVLDKEVRGATIPVPPLDEQRRIVAILEDHLSRLATATASLAAASRSAESLTESALQSALSAAQAKDVALVELLSAKLANGRSVPTRDDGFPVLRLTALGDRFIDLAERKGGAWTAEEARPFLVTGGDLLVSRGNGSLNLVARVGIVPDEPAPVAFPDTMVRVRPDVAKVRADYLALVWNSRVVRKQIESAVRTTAGIYKLNQQQLGSVRIPVPPLDDQERIAAEVRDAEDARARLVAATHRASREAAALRRSLLVTAFRGDLTTAGSVA